MRILVLGASGTVGSLVARELVARGHEVHALTRGGKPLPDGVAPVMGDLLDVQTIRSAFRGMDGAFLVNGWSTSEAHEGLMAVNGCMEARVGRVVYLSVTHVEDAAWLPHFGAKVGVETAVRSSGLPYTILRPNNFFQNDLWLREAITQYGFYPQPIGGVGLSRIDVRDIAEAAAVALTEDGHAGRVYELGGPEVVTGPSTAAAWSAALGREVQYAGDDLDAWELRSLQFLPPLMVYDFRRMYEYFQQRGLIATAEQLATQTRLIGHPPRAFADFAREQAIAWGATASLPA